METHAPYDSSDEDELVYIGSVSCIIAFQSTNEVELDLKVGDVVHLTRKDVGAGWWEGALNGVLGLFPEKYVKEIEASATAAGGGGGDALEGDYIAATGGVVPRTTLPATNPFAGTAGASGGGAGAESESDYVAATGGIVRAGGGAAGGSTSPKVRPPRPASLPTQEAPSMKFVTLTPTILQGCKWQRPAGSETPERYWVKANEAKGSKFGGMKSFVTYDIETDSTGKSVQRRFKHFDWLREQLIRIYPCVTIPPIPGKEMKLKGKFDQDFVQQRTQGLQKFLDRIAVHPVLGVCPVVKHFLTAVEQKDWKIGKRDAEVQKVFTSAVSMPSGPRTVGGDLAGHIEESSQFVLWLQQQLESWNGSAEVMGNHWAELAQSYTTMSDEVKRFEEISVNQNFKTWWSKAELCPVKKLMTSLSELGSGMENVAIMMKQHNEVQMGSLVQALDEYSNLVKQIPTVTHGPKWKESLLVQGEGEADVATVSNVLLAEFRHFHETLVTDLKQIVGTFIQQQVAYHQQLASTWQSLLPAFET